MLSFPLFFFRCVGRLCFVSVAIPDMHISLFYDKNSTSSLSNVKPTEEMSVRFRLRALKKYFPCNNILFYRTPWASACLPIFIHEDGHKTNHLYIIIFDKMHQNSMSLNYIFCCQFKTLHFDTSFIINARVDYESWLYTTDVMIYMCNSALDPCQNL
jgi:hypothetical protein